MHSVSGSLKLSELTRVILGCIGGFIGLLVMLVMFFFVRKKIELKRQGLPMILQETNFMNDLQEGTSHVEVKQENGQSATSQRDSLVAQVRKRNSSYRSQLSSAASAGTVITYAEGMPYILRKYLKIAPSKHSDSEYRYKNADPTDVL